ncbi:MAG: hypothetical protein QOH04_2612 [Sphingomonadales bacterium]|nr:hypothetical protein [Sphingomonadales bacterium]
MTAPLRVLVACEFSGTVRNAFLARGHDAWSCDLLAAADGSNRHIRGDARDLLGDGWDLLMVAHPPCTRLCNSGVRWLTRPPRGRTLAAMWAELDEAASLSSNAPATRSWPRTMRRRRSTISTPLMCTRLGRGAPTGGVSAAVSTATKWMTRRMPSCSPSSIPSKA